MHLRFVVPALGLIALSATAASAQEIAKGVTLDGYLDTVATATTNDSGTSNKTPSTTDFSSEAVIKVGWSLADGKINSVVSTRTTNDQGSLKLVEAYASIKATPEVTVYAGESYGPFGYYSGYATGLTTINRALTFNMYTVNPVGAWLAYAPNEKVTVTGILADGFSGQANNSPVNSAYQVNGAAYKASKPGTVSPGLDVVFNPTPELSLNVEGYLDPSAGVNGAVYFGGFNIQFKKDAILAAGEVLYQVTEGGKNGSSDSSSLSWAAFVTYTLPADAPFAGAVTGQLSQYMPGETGTAAGVTTEKDTITKAQLALLTNPFTVSQFGLNYELFYVMDDKNNNVANKSLDTYGVAIEGLFVIP